MYIHTYTYTYTYTLTYAHTHVYTYTLTYAYIYAYESTYMYTLITSINVLKDAEAHLLLATQEHSYYKSLIETAKAVLQQTFSRWRAEAAMSSRWLSPGTQKITMHYSFDMAQVSMGRKKNVPKLTSYSIILPLSIRPTAARTHVLSDVTKVWDLWHLL